MKVVITPNQKNAERIEGFCKLPSWREERAILSLIKTNAGWIVGRSMCLPSNLNDALIVQECVQKVFKTVECYRA